MVQTPSEKPSAPALSGEDVATYLAAHPDFLAAHPELLTKIVPPAQQHKSKSVVDFQHFMLRRLQGDIERQTEEKRDLIFTARTNLNLLTRIHAAVLALLESQSFEQLIAAITGDLAVYLDVDIAALMIEAKDADMGTMKRGDIRIVPPGQIDEWLGDRDVVLQGNIAGDPTIYGEAATLIRSEALLRLEVSHFAPVGMLAFGSRQPDLFQDGQGTELIGFMARVVERCIRAWLDLPE